ncbi:MAG: HAD family hydrolase, partial [Christensenellales bacterium]
MMYTLYLFDFDLTLADTSKAILACYRSVLRDYGYEGICDEDIVRTIGTSLEKSFGLLTGVTDGALLRQYRREYSLVADEVMTRDTVIFP